MRTRFAPDLHRKPVRTRLTGYEGPLLDSQIWISTEELHRNVLEPHVKSVKKFMVENAARRVPGFLRKARSKTSDRYKWWLGLYFLVGDDEIVAILIPNVCPWRGADEVPLDRPVAVYVRGGVKAGEADAILREFMTELKKELGIPGA